MRIKSATRRMLGLSIKDTPKSRPSTASRTRPMSAVSTLSATSSSDLQPAFTTSLFAHVPPTINFVTEGEKGTQ